MSVAFWCLRHGASRPFVSSSIVPSCNSWTIQSPRLSTINRFYSSRIAKTTKRNQGSHIRQPKGQGRPTRGGVIQELKIANSQPRQGDPIKRVLQDEDTIQPDATLRTEASQTSSRTLQSSSIALQALRAKHPGPARVLYEFLTRDAPYIYKAPSQRGIVVVTFLVSAFCIGASLLFTSLGTTMMPEGVAQIATRAYLIVAGFFLVAIVFLCMTPRKIIKSIKVVERNEKVYFEALVKPYLYLPGRPRTAIIDPLKFSASTVISAISTNYEKRKAYEQLNKPGKGASLIQRTNYKIGMAFSTTFENIALGVLRDGLVSIHEKGGQHIGRLDARGYFPNSTANGVLLDKLSVGNKDS